MPVALVWSPAYTMDWARHVFPVRKYERTRERLIALGLAAAGGFLVPVPATDAELTSVHPPAYLARLDELTATPELGILEFEVPVTAQVVAGFRLMCGGTLLAARRALAGGAAVNLGGGFHHAFADRGEGFCLLNDLAVAARVLLDEGAAGKVAVVDLDVHQGNGTARIFAGEPRVFTFSMHQENNYPIKEESDLDLGLEDRTGDDEYLRRLGPALLTVLDRFRPDLVLYQAGADPYHQDRLGGLALSVDGLAERDRRVAAECRRRGVPVAATLGGGYAARTDDVAAIHANTVRALQEAYG
jgi:acetoin utilization deacetylase AcuC-like enzyme